MAETAQDGWGTEAARSDHSERGDWKKSLAYAHFHWGHFFSCILDLNRTLFWWWYCILLKLYSTLHTFFWSKTWSYKRNTILPTSRPPQTYNCDSLLDVPNVKDVSSKWERSNTSPDIYYMYCNQMEATHSSQYPVIEVTPVPHKKCLPLPSMATGLCCLQQQTLG